MGGSNFMEKKDDLIEIAKQLLKRTDEKLQSAQILIENDQIDDAISRAYYAAFLASKALLYLLGSEPKSHSGIMTMFGLKVVKQGLLPPSIGHSLNELFKARETSDYAIISFYNKSDGIQYIEKAQTVTDAIKKLISTKFGIEIT